MIFLIEYIGFWNTENLKNIHHTRWRVSEMNELIEYMDSINADGIDFVELSFPINDRIIASYTKEEFAKYGIFYKTNRKYWRIVNGEKHYYCGENESGYDIWKNIHSLKNDMKLDDIKLRISNIGEYM